MYLKAKLIKTIQKSVMAAALLVLTGCASTVVKSDVERIHSMPDDVTGKSFFVFPDGAQEGTQEFSLYAQDIAENLILSGMVESPIFESADYIVQYRYNVGDAREESVTTRSRSGGEFVSGMGMVTTGNSAGQTFLYEGQRPVEVSEETTTNTVYDKVLEVDISDREKSMANAQNIAYVYEGRVSSSGSSGSFMSVSRCLFDALLKKFPGVSGQTSRAMGFSPSCAR
jgi:hypothetical protein